MALFKISKGDSSKLGSQKTIEGFCWFTPDDGKFYIDIAGTADNPQTATVGTNRICLNADKATKDAVGNVINTYYASNSKAIGSITAGRGYYQLKNISGTNISTVPLEASNLVWGSANTYGDIGPIEASLSAMHSANRAELCNSVGVTIEYSTDNGDTWTDYGATDNEKIQLFSAAYTSNFYLGKVGNTKVTTTRNRLRITMNATKMGIYTNLKRVLINYTSNGVGGSKVMIEISNKGSEDTWKTIGTYDISGWSGWNSYGAVQGAFGGSDDQTSNKANIRLTFYYTNIVNNSNNNPGVQNILLFGTTAWTTPSNLARTGHLYSWDIYGDAYFPGDINVDYGGVYADTFYGDLDGNADTATFAKKATALATTTNINGIKYNGTANVLNYAVCSTAAATAEKTVYITNFTLTTGASIKVKFTNSNTAANPTLNVSGTGAKPIYRYGTTAASSTPTSSGWQAGAVMSLTYDGTGWIRDYWYNTTYNRPVPECSTSGTVASKSAYCSTFNLEYNHYFQLLLLNTNTIQSALTLNVNGTGAKPIYINDAPTSTTNYTLPAGIYFVYYDGTAFQFRTDGQLPGQVKADEYLPLSAGKDYPLTGPLYLTQGQGYATSLPSSASEGELFFVVTDEEAPVLYRGDYTATSALSSIPMPTVIANNIGKSGYLLRFYQNGLLLSEGINYSVDSTNKAISLSGYTCRSGDVFIFELMTEGMIKGLDTTVYATKEYVEGRLGNFDLSTKYLPLSGGTMTGSINMGGYNITNGGNITGSKVYGAVWNDYAEYREADTTEPGVVVCENGDDTMSISNCRMQPAAAIVSDTFGFAIGETDKAKTPIAVSGRVLAKPYEPIEEFRKAIGRPVCAGPNGTVSIMTDEEYAAKGYCAIGTISAVPDYEIWHNGIAVNSRVWIKVR